jgi:hypothetical protein
MTVEACTPNPVTPGIVVFDYEEWIATYPSFATVPQAAVASNFTAATLMLENSCCSVVSDAPTRQQLLYLLTAHITALLNGVNGQPPQGVVGRISNATEGAVSVAVAYSSSVSQSEAYFTQTPWGAQYWQSTLPFRSARYVPGPNNCGNYPSANYAWPQ